jgi:NADH dehydrogenase FAD-containing subunit
MVFLQKVTVCGENGWLVTFNKVNGTENIYAIGDTANATDARFSLDCHG